MLKTVLIDDNELELEYLLDLLSKYSVIDVVAKFTSPLDAIKFLQHNQIDLLFSDVEMPTLKGTDLAKILNQVPILIFCTSHIQYAFDAFELNALDFLNKPIQPERLAKTIQKINDYHAILDQHPQQEEPEIKDNTFYLKIDGNYVKLKVNDILYIEALSNFCKLHLVDNRIITAYGVIGFFEKLLASKLFIRIHRSYLVNSSAIAKFNTEEVVLSNESSLPVGNSYKEGVKKNLLKGKYITYR